MSAPKLFISYSWTSPDHEAWVLEFATELRESGVDVVLDKWDLREGHDANAFMEKMVTDEAIKKVVLICDRAYVEKADLRSGGVGTEAQIISGELYAKGEQDKFVAVVRQRDESGAACLPAYYSSRIYIDLSDPTSYSDNFDRLVRWAFDKPVYKKPDIGEPPSFLEQGEGAAALATASRFRRAIDAIRSNKDYADGASSDYLQCFAQELEKFRLTDGEGEFDDRVVNNVESFLPFRNEAIEFFEAVAQYRDSHGTRVMLHRFFEQLIPLMERPQHITQHREWDFDNFKFIVHELFLYAVAVLIRHERFESAAYMLGNEYYLPGRSEYGRDVMVPFEVFRQYMKSLEYRKRRLNLRRLSIRADMLEQRCKGIGVPFRDLLQVDFILFVRAHLDRPNEQWHWWPETLLYASRHSGPFEVFARSRSAAYFEQVKVLLGVSNRADLTPMLDSFEGERNRLPRWEHESFWPKALIGFDELCTRP